MLRDLGEKYFLEKDYNCAESTLRMINEKYNLNLDEEDFKLVSAFGAGMGCGKTCGALAGGLAAIGKLAVKERAHATDGFKELCAEYVDEFTKKLSSINCDDIKPIYRTEERRCIAAVELAADVFEEFAKKHNLIK